MKEFEKGGYDAAVIYKGGGNLMMLYSSEEKYYEANKIISLYVLKEYPTLQLIASHTECTGKFKEDEKKLYQENSKVKNTFPHCYVDAVTPMTQIDPLTFLPVTEKKSENGAPASFSSDRFSKREKMNGKETPEEPNQLIAVIHIDGNMMGQKLKNCLFKVSDDSYDNCVKELRKFALDVDQAFIQNTEKRIDEVLGKAFHRFVITGGDDLTFVCYAKDAWKAISAYFDSLEKSSEIGGSKNYSCAGIAIAHAKSPFSMVYDIAEEACDSAKSRSRVQEGNYFDFHYIHAGITNGLEELRNSQQKDKTGRPYSFNEAKECFEKAKPILNLIGRANVKALGAAWENGESDYNFEVKRILAYLARMNKIDSSNNAYGLDDVKSILEQKELVYDMAEFFDLWFTEDKK